MYLHAVYYLPFIYSPRNPTVTYHFSDLQWQLTVSHKMSVAIFIPTSDINKWQMSLCNNSPDNKSYWTHKVYVIVSAQVTTANICTVKHLLLDRVDKALTRDHYYQVTTFQEVFNDISCETIRDFLTKVQQFYKIWFLYINNIRFYKIVIK